MSKAVITGKRGEYCNIMKIIEQSDITAREKEAEKVKVTEARKKTFGKNYKHFPPWK